MIPDPNLIEDLRLLEPLNPLWFWLGGAAVALILGAVGLLRRRRRRGRRPRPAAPGRPPHEVALEALARLRSLLNPQESRRYGIESSTIIRHYIEPRFEIRAPFQATEEFLVAASQSPRLEPRHRELLQDYLGQCDLLKFARNRASQDELQSLHNAAVRFVNESIPAAPPADAARLAPGRTRA